MLDGRRANAMAGGHSHMQMLRRCGETPLVNPGSVGPPYERALATGIAHHPPWAEYAVVGWAQASISVEFRRVPFDANALIQLALQSGMPHARWWTRGRQKVGNR
jgi:hypothetical protein